VWVLAVTAVVFAALKGRWVATESPAAARAHG